MKKEYRTISISVPQDVFEHLQWLKNNEQVNISAHITALIKERLTNANK